MLDIAIDRCGIAKPWNEINNILRGRLPSKVKTPRNTNYSRVVLGQIFSVLKEGRGGGDLVGVGG